MSKAPAALSSMPPVALEALKRLGEDLAIARVRRRESQRVWSQRLGVSVPTLIRLEQGDPGVSMGIYATALWLISRTPALAQLADPQHDRGALELDIRKALRQHTRRKRSHD